MFVMVMLHGFLPSLSLQAKYLHLLSNPPVYSGSVLEWVSQGEVAIGIGQMFWVLIMPVLLT